MKIAIRLGILVALGGCGGGGSSSAGGCNLGSALYAGLVDLSKTNYLTSVFSGQGSSQGYGGVAVYVAVRDAGALPQVPNCGSAAETGGCCYIAPPVDGGDGSSGDGTLSNWTVTVSNVTQPHQDQIFMEGAGPASLTYVPWVGGDELMVKGDGAGVGSFSGEVKTPLDFAGLSPNVFSDAGAIPVGKSLPLSWTSGGAPSVTILVQDGATLGQVICTVPDNGSFTIPGSVLSHFQSGDQGGVALLRSSDSCVYDSTAAISFSIHSLTTVTVAFE